VKACRTLEEHAVSRRTFHELVIHSDNLGVAGGWKTVAACITATL
jgi:hypothetical protein